ncbi:MAG: sigma factor [Bacteroidota bacterium]
MVATLLYCSRDIDPDTAEDLVHDSFSEALVQWRLKGIPLNPNGWIYTVYRNKALNKIKKTRDYLSRIIIKIILLPRSNSVNR